MPLHEGTLAIADDRARCLEHHVGAKDRPYHSQDLLIEHQRRHLGPLDQETIERQPGQRWYDGSRLGTLGVERGGRELRHQLAHDPAQGIDRLVWECALEDEVAVCQEPTACVVEVHHNTEESSGLAGACAERVGSLQEGAGRPAARK